MHTQLERELEELEEIKRQNLGHFINKLKRELEDLWKKAYVGDEEQRLFEPYLASK